MTIKISCDGFFTELRAINNQNIQVFPHLKSKCGVPVKGVDITLTGKNEGYHLVDLEQFINHIANGAFDEIGRVRMKQKNGSQSNGFFIVPTLCVGMPPETLCVSQRWSVA